MYALYMCDAGFNAGGLPDLTPRPDTPVREVNYIPGSGEGPALSEEIYLGLEGYPHDLESYVSQLGRALEQAQREADIPGGAHLFLVCQAAMNEFPWRSKLLGGEILAPGPADQRNQGAQRVILKLRRANWWERADAARLLLRQNPQGWSAALGLEISNHSDAAHSNWLDLPQMDATMENISGDLPAPAVLAINTPNATTPLTYFVGLSWRKNVTQLSPVHSGPSGTARGGAVSSLVSDAGSAGGQYLRLDWSGAEEREVWGVDISVADAKILAGYPALPLLRLALPLGMGVTSWWYRWRVYALEGAAEYLCAESSLAPMEANCELLSGPALDLPPWLVDQGNPMLGPGLRLALVVQPAGSGAHALGVDSLYLLGLDGWRIYRPLTSQASVGITDDGGRGTLYRFGSLAQSHAAEGPGLLLQPGRAHRLMILALSHGAGGKTVPVDLAGLVWVWHRARKRKI